MCLEYTIYVKLGQWFTNFLSAEFFSKKFFGAQNIKNAKQQFIKNNINIVLIFCLLNKKNKYIIKNR